MDKATMGVRDAEQQFLRWWGWVFPAAGVGVAMLTGGGFWAWVDGAVPWLEWRQAFTARGAALALAGGILALAWRALVRRKWPDWALALAVAAVFAAMECVVRIPAVQTAFWLATRTRFDANGPNFMSEVCYIRLEEAAGRVAVPGAVILSGTSQMLCGVDELELARMLAPVGVIRREVSGMVPQKMLAVWPWIPFRRGDLNVQMRSEMDFTNQAAWRTAWFRPFLTWKTLPWLMRNAGGRVCWPRWREMVDCALAASLESWRMRDGVQTITMNLWHRDKSASAKSKPAAEDVASAHAALAWCEWEWQAFMDAAERMKEIGVELVVIEGNVNPMLHDERRTEMRQEFERRMEDGMRKGLWRFVDEKELGAGIESGDWRDMTHVNEEGRVKLTKAVRRVLAGKNLPD